MATRPPDQEVLLDATEGPCPYLPGERSCTPLRYQLVALSPDAFDDVLAAGNRRIGRMLYRTECRACRACEPLRIPAAALRPDKSQRRAWRRNRDLRVEIGPLRVTDEHLALFNRHKAERGLTRDEGPMSPEGYARWFVESCTATLEMRYLAGDRLVAVGIVDVGHRDSSSVYFYFDPAESRRSLGTFSVLAECAWLAARGGRHHYLGLHVAACRHLAYKARFYPHERLVGGEWRPYTREAPAGDLPEARP